MANDGWLGPTPASLRKIISPNLCNEYLVKTVCKVLADVAAIHLHIMVGDMIMI